MQTLTTLNKMLFCPKCQRKYEDGSQRFCISDGARLNPQKISQNTAQPVGVFSGILNKNGLIEEPLEHKPLPPKQTTKSLIDTREPEAKTAQKNTNPKTPQTFTKLIKPDEILNRQAQLGDRRVNPVGRVALSADNPNILLGQTIKGRYFIKSRISQTAHSINYSATDNLDSGKKVNVRIFTGNLNGSDFSAKIFADERVALSHINHPNVAKVFDSGELPEGNPFIVSAYVKGNSIKENPASEKRFSVLQTARIIRQAANGLSEAHQNGVLHRNLKPENLVLNTGENGIEQIKITDFNIFSDKTRGEFHYLAPEQISGNSSNFAADIYSLAVIAFQMLTGKMPFNALTSKELLKAQQKDLQNTAIDSDSNIPKETFDILQKALSFDPAKRFHSVRDFGDAFYTAATSNNEERIEPPVKNFKTTEVDDFSVSLDSVLDETFDKNEPEIKTPSIIEPRTLRGVDPAIEDQTLKIDDLKVETENAEPELVEEPVELEIEKPFRPIRLPDSEITKPKSLPKAEEKSDSPWERRSFDPPVEGGRNWTMLAGLGVLLTFVVAASIFYYFFNRPAQPKFDNSNANIPTNEILNSQADAEKRNDIEIPPPPRKIEQPENTLFFENSKENLSRELLKYYHGFALYYPKDWKINKFDKNRNKVDDKFVDISKNDPDGIPIEQFMVSYYDSAGTYQLDEPNFPEIINKASEDIKKSPLPNFQLVGSGLINLNKAEGYEGWKAYEMKFQGEGTAMNGDKIKLFGRRFYIPAARQGIKKGLVVTLLATSLSKDVQSANDLGEKGDLKTILSTFEPDQNF